MMLLERLLFIYLQIIKIIVLLSMTTIWCNKIFFLLIYMQIAFNDLCLCQDNNEMKGTTHKSISIFVFLRKSFLFLIPAESLKLQPTKPKSTKAKKEKLINLFFSPSLFSFSVYPPGDADN